MNKRLAISFGLLLLLAPAAGPVRAEHGGPSGWQPVRDLMAGVPCEVAEVGESTTANLRLLRRVTYADTSTHGELDIRGHLALVARFQDAAGFEVVDISDPLNARVIGRTSSIGAAHDVKFSPDGQLAFVGGDAGIVMVDIRIPSFPVRRGEWFFPPGVERRILQNAHMLYTAQIAGQQWVFVAPNSTTGVWILRVGGTPSAPTLTKVAQTLPVEGGPLGPHDMWVTYDADLAKHVLYVADAFHGWLAFDVSNPEAPQLLGGFPHPSTGYTHTIQAATIGGRRIVATIEEVGVNFLKVYDATNLAAPVLLGVWQAHPGTGSADPQHNFQIVDGRLYMAHDGHGMYVFDLRTLSALPLAGTLDLRPMAHYADTGAGGPNSFVGVWDVVLRDGLLYLSHRTQGLQVVGFGCNEPGSPALTSTG